MGRRRKQTNKAKPVPGTDPSEITPELVRQLATLIDDKTLTGAQRKIIVVNSLPQLVDVPNLEKCRLASVCPQTYYKYRKLEKYQDAEKQYRHNLLGSIQSEMLARYVRSARYGSDAAVVRLLEEGKTFFPTGRGINIGVSVNLSPEELKKKREENRLEGLGKYGFVPVQSDN